MASRKKIRYAVIGPGNIAQEAVLPAFAHARSSSELVAIVSADAEKRAALSEKYELSLTGSYAELERVLAEGDIDAVYISTPNSTHESLAVRAAQAGVHVLCEKPLANSVADCETIGAACEGAGVKLMVAYRLHFEEANLGAIEVVKSGKIGSPLVFDSVFSHVVRPGDIRTRPEVGGGAVFDLGIYCINAARNLFREEPRAAFATMQERDGTDETTSAILRFSHGRVAQFTVSNAAASVSSYRIAGSDGDLRVEPAFDYVGKLEHHLTVGGKTETKSFSRRDQFAPELEYFSTCILEGRSPEPDVEEAICDLRVIEAIRESAKTGRLIELLPQQRSRRPDSSQEAKKPPVSKQEPFHAPSPSLK